MEACVISSCSKCQARYRVAREKVGAGGARLRCSSCQNIFMVQAPEVTPVVFPKAAGTVRALVAEADEDAAKRIVEFLSSWGIQAVVVQDGAEALLRLFRHAPDLAILGGHLPGVSAPIAVEIIRRSSELGKLKLIRVAPLDEPAGAPEFEADHTLEPADLPDGLARPLAQLGIGECPPVAPTPPAAPPPEPRPAAKRPKAASDPDPAIAAAERLSRIIVSDIILYNEDRFDQAAQQGDVQAALADDLVEAKKLFEQRIPAEIRAKRDFLGIELEAQAEKRRR